MSSVSLRPVLADSWSELATSRVLRLGLGGALALYTGLALLWVFCVPLFGPADERAHVDYAWQVAHGHLPVAGSQFVAEFPQLGQESYVQHVANHPPLYYAITGPVLRLTDAMGHPAAGLYTLRLLNAAATFLTILVIARLAATITAGVRHEVRVAVVVVASVLAAVNPALLAASGAIQNDAPSILLAALVALVIARAARTGMDARAVALVAVLCTLGTLTRVTFLTVVAVAVLFTVALSLWPGLRRRRPDGEALVRAAGRGLAVLAAVVAGAGWFLLLNLHRYGDLTGGSAVYTLDSVEARHLAPGAGSGPLVYLLHPATWWTQLRQLVAPVPSLSDGKLRYDLLTMVLVVVLVLAVAAAVRRRGVGPLDRPGAVGMLLLAVVLGGSMAKLAVHVSHRGGANQRYLLDGLGLWAVGGALLLVALGRLAPHAVALVAAMGASGTVLYAAGIVARSDESVGASTFTDLRESLLDSPVPGAGLICVLALVAAAAGLATAVSAVGQALRAPQESGPGGTDR